jgi:hypothetical protein
MPAGLARAVGATVEEVGGATLLVAPGLPVTLFNRAIGLGVARPATRADLDAIVARYRAARVPTFRIHHGPHARPAELPAWLADAGLTPVARGWSKFVRGAEPPPVVPTALAVAPVPPGREDETAAALARAHSMPPPVIGWVRALIGRDRWRAYSALDGDRVVGGAMMFEDGDGAWLGLGGVVSEARRHGGQGALLARRIADAIAAGRTLVTTETGAPGTGADNPSHRNILRAGFRVVVQREQVAGCGAG